jgi:hypothetical protein
VHPVFRDEAIMASPLKWLLTLAVCRHAMPNSTRRFQTKSSRLWISQFERVACPAVAKKRPRKTGAVRMEEACGHKWGQRKV